MSYDEFKRITRLVGKAIADFDLIREGDKVLVALSGGKDSWTLLYALEYLRRKAPVNFELAAVTIHPGTPGFDSESVERRLSCEGITHWTLPGNIVDVVNQNLSMGTNPCSFCARLRRGMLYTFAAANGWNKLALGHHLDDFIETLLLNLIFNGTLKGMSPELKSDDGRNTVIRPLVYVREDQTRLYAQSAEVPIIGCSCGYQGLSGSRRQWVKALLASVEQEVPNAKSSMLAAMGRVQPRHLLTAVKPAERPAVAKSAEKRSASRGAECLQE